LNVQLQIDISDAKDKHVVEVEMMQNMLNERKREVRFLRDSNDNTIQQFEDKYLEIRRSYDEMIDEFDDRTKQVSESYIAYSIRNTTHLRHSVYLILITDKKYSGTWQLRNA
jgi:bisphosphoglycerate-dependent phosphoglycerate mutase